MTRTARIHAATPDSFAARLRRHGSSRRSASYQRSSREAWPIWVSEVMLQQTRVAAVCDAWARFVQRFPDPRSLATATDDELNAAWRGLGYYRRARLLREGARVVVRDHGGRVPSAPEALGRLPGVGAYTLGAVASIAFGEPLLAIDGNVERVTARHRSIRGDVKKRAGRRLVESAVVAWFDRTRAGDFNQALMELGAVVCTPRRPACDRCPVAQDCRGRGEGTVDRLPERPARRACLEVAARALAIARNGDFLAMRVPGDEPNAGQWELPGAGILRSVAAADLPRAIADRCGARVRVGPPLSTVRHAITHHRIDLTVHAGEALRRGSLQAVSPTDLSAPWTTACRKAFARLLEGQRDA